MNKRYLLLLTAMVTGCFSPTTEAIQTAIAQTEAVEIKHNLIIEPASTNTMTPAEIVDYSAPEIAEYPTSTPWSSNIQIPECANAPLGENTTCKISRAYCSYQPSVGGKPTFCNDAPYPNHNFTLLAWGQDWSKYDGKCLIVTGYIHLYKGKPEIEAESDSQVRICN